LRRKAISLLEIGMGRAKGDFKIAKVEADRRKDVDAKGDLSSVPSNFLFRFGAF
jgi:thioredoxin-like negative regulator of GroEL